MEKQEMVKIRMFYMWFWRDGRRQRSPEYRTFADFYKACGAWCSKHPFDWQLCTSDRYEPKGAV